MAVALEVFASLAARIEGHKFAVGAVAPSEHHTHRLRLLPASLWLGSLHTV
jgi:hypothetical protein